ncbi:hypothetical protein [Bacteriovorax sp. DB6_IX]|uniref:hypothetical protein n=1 Tax=Bacteriovorax sp. DB6_IX TaxID=1353530 RepID=UPI00042690F6|nr:hypothetical protein [Bacteriovorax sp. DB6_IX]
MKFMNKLTRNKKSVYSLILCLLLVGCMETKRKTNSTSSSSNNNYNNDQYQYGNGNSGSSNGSGSGSGSSGEQTDDGTGYGDGNEDGVADGGQTQEYITIGNIALHGTGGLNRFYPNGGPLWSSTNQLSSSDQGIFYTDARFNLRIRPQSAPGQNTNDSLGNKCQYLGNPYKKLSVDICLRSQTGSCIYTHSFEEVTVGQVSKVKEFTVPNTSAPLVVEVLGVRWDYACQNYLDQGYSESDAAVNGVCPMGQVWDTSCVKFDIQFSTDHTKDFPSSAPRY